MTTESKTPILENRASESLLIRIRVRKEDSAYVYAILEAQDGIVAYSTLDYRPGDHHRDLELIVPLGFTREVNDLLEVLQTELGGELYVLSTFETSSSSRTE